MHALEPVVFSFPLNKNSTYLLHKVIVYLFSYLDFLLHKFSKKNVQVYLFAILESVENLLKFRMQANSRVFIIIQLIIELPLLT